MNAIEKFDLEVAQTIENMKTDAELSRLSKEWFNKSVEHKYSYLFTWMGIPIIQYPQDIVLMQELVQRIKPDLIIETGIAHGGSLVFYASMMELLGADGHVIGVDIDIRSHNRERLEKHPMFKRITLLEGSSIDPEMVGKVSDLAASYQNPLVVLDSLHTHEHVLAELRAYSALVKSGGYVVVFDTVVEDIPDSNNADRPWSVGNNPKTAVHAFVKENDAFVIDNIESKLLLTVAPDGFLRRVK